MKLLQEFKEFAVKGNVLDLAVGVIIGGVFGKIVSSLVNDIIMPPIGFVLNGIDFKNLKWILRHNPDGTPLISINYGNFIQTFVEFLIISFVVFMLVRFLTKLQKRFHEEKKQEEKKDPPAPPEEVVLLREIRDSLKKVIR